MKTYLITGVSGFLGSRLAEKLLQNSYSVIGITRDKSASVIANLENYRSFKCLEAEINETSLNILSTHHIDGVYHLAAQIPVRYDIPYEEYYKSNVEVTKCLIDYFNNKNIDFFVYSSTSSVFGEPSVLISENTNPTPMDHYGLTKFISEKLLQFGFKESDTKKIVVRYQSIFGPGDSYGVVNTFYKKCKLNQNIELQSRGMRLRNLISAEDSVNILYQIISKFPEFENFEIFQAASENSMSLSDIAGVIKKHLNSSSQIVLLDVKGNYDWDIFIDTSKIKQLLGIQPNFMEDGINKYIKLTEDEL